MLTGNAEHLSGHVDQGFSAMAEGTSMSRYLSAICRKTIRTFLTADHAMVMRPGEANAQNKTLDWTVIIIIR